MREERSKIQSIKIQEVNEVTYREGERLTKIELNIENSEDDIDFIGYGQLRYSNKKDQSRSPSQIKESFTRISPAREIVMTKDRNLTTRPFTPNTSEKKSTLTREVVTSTLHNGQVVAHHTESHVLSTHQEENPEYTAREEEVMCSHPRLLFASSRPLGSLLSAIDSTRVESTMKYCRRDIRSRNYSQNTNPS